VIDKPILMKNDEYEAVPAPVGAAFSIVAVW